MGSLQEVAEVGALEGLLRLLTSTLLFISAPLCFLTSTLLFVSAPLCFLTSAPLFLKRAPELFRF